MTVKTGSVISLGELPTPRALQSSLQEDVTPMLVMYRGQTATWPGASSTRNISACPTGGSASSLSHVLEMDLPASTLAKYSLTRNVKNYVLTSAAGRGKPLSEFLEHALRQSPDIKDR